MTEVAQIEPAGLVGYMEGSKPIRRVIRVMSKVGASPNAIMTRITGITVLKERNYNIAALCAAYGSSSAKGFIIQISKRLKAGLGITEDQARFIAGESLKLARDAMDDAELLALQAMDASIRKECARLIGLRGVMPWDEAKKTMWDFIQARIDFYKAEFARWRND